MARRKEKYGTGRVRYVENQRPLTDDEKTKLHRWLEDATSITYDWQGLRTVIGPYGHIISELETLTAAEVELREKGWELKWTRKRKPRKTKDQAWLQTQRAQQTKEPRLPASMRIAEYLD